MNTLLMEMHLERKAGKNPTDRAWWYLPFRDRGKEEPWKQRGEGPERWAENREKTTWEL